MESRCLPAVAALLLAVSAAGAAQPDGWTLLRVPGVWEELAPQELGGYDGYAWYRCYVEVPAAWKKDGLELWVEQVDNVHEAYINGHKVGGAGEFPPNYASGLGERRKYPIPAEIIAAGAYNVVALRVYDHDGRGGFKGKPPALVFGNQATDLEGQWQFRTGDDPAWALPAEEPAERVASFSKRIAVADLDKKTSAAGASPPLSPEESLRHLKTLEDLEIVPVLAEPLVRQPIFLTFDERGRMWVANYEQYPYPAGLKPVSKDEYWRTVYDKVPPPPPNHYRGRDRITIHEDTDGDGQFDRHKVFVEGLSIASSCVKGRGGVWVLNPPYLLFYPDRDNDDVPDGDPEVHLSGFGIEDTHSVVNSLRWGPDGWLYAAQGSTVSGNVIRPGLDKQGVHSMGQLIWRYHPETRRYEIFAEGGGNAFGLEFDERGWAYSGHNGGDTRGFHYVQGGYYRKGFAKHGPLSNPYAFGFFEAMQHGRVPRFTHNFILYDGGALPEQYRGKLFGVEPLQGRVVYSLVEPHTSTFKTRDLGHALVSTDMRFRPVDIKVGPDGAIYVCDMYELLISHRQHFEGQVERTDGRIYRIQAQGARPLAPFDLGRLKTAELVPYLDHANKWFRQEALRQFGDRKDQSVVPLLKETLAHNTGRLALGALWAMYQSGGFNDELALDLCRHEDPYVRMWTVRLLCDENRVSPAVARELAALAGRETYVHVRSQLASSAKRLPAEVALPILAQLLKHDEDRNDLHVPLLLWWGIESKCARDADAVLALFQEPQMWQWPLVQEHILQRLMKRFAMSGSRNDLLVCARLFELAPSQEHSRILLQGFEEAFKGRSLADLPPVLVEQLARQGGGSVILGLRQGRAEAIQQALAAIADEKSDRKQRLEYITVFGEIDQPQAVPVLLEVVDRSSDDELRMAALTALLAYDDASIGARVIAVYGQLNDDVRAAAHTLLASRKAWARQLVEAVDSGSVEIATIPLDVVRKLTIHRDERIAELVSRHWRDVGGATSEEMQAHIARYSAVLANGRGDPYAGKKLYAQSCGKCHILFGDGGRIGPDLTSYKRDDTLQMLLNVVNPSAEIREGFETVLVITDDGRVATGFRYDEDSRVLVLRGVDGQNITIPRERIEEILPQPKSIMPEGLLKDLTEQQVRDLFAYLRSSQPLNQ